jgi:hypothetical protein
MSSFHITIEHSDNTLEMTLNSLLLHTQSDTAKSILYKTYKIETNKCDDCDDYICQYLGEIDTIKLCKNACVMFNKIII